MAPFSKICSFTFYIDLNLLNISDNEGVYYTISFFVIIYNHLCSELNILEVVLDTF